MGLFLCLPRFVILMFLLLLMYPLFLSHLHIYNDIEDLLREAPRSFNCRKVLLVSSVFATLEANTMGKKNSSLHPKTSRKNHVVTAGKNVSRFLIGYVGFSKGPVLNLSIGRCDRADLTIFP